ncbi:MAG: HNH endonuclease [Oscillospiraceae bacterium]|nr:HNH endonuclease [Oscillospiraceae bacterium]
MNSFENYVYKAEVNWSLLTEGLTLPVENQVIFARNMGTFLQRGESKEISLYLNGKRYKAHIYNVNFDSKFNRNKDTLQIRYPRNGNFSKALQICFSSSYIHIESQRMLRLPGDRTMIKVPEERKEYLAIYTTEYDDSYVLETIEANDILLLRQAVQNNSERIFESSFNYDVEDFDADMIEDKRIVKIRKLNRKIGDNLKLLYGYRCQICGRLIGEDYGAHVVEAHHIDYFVSSLNNDANNQLIVCPNHHSIIHEINPVFDRPKLIYIYPNGIQEGLMINQHLNFN